MAKKKEMTVEEKLRALYDLQLIHSRLDQIQNTRGELPLEVEDLKDDIIGLETRVSKIEEQIKEFKDDISAHKKDIKNSETLMEKYTKQQDNVRNNREFEALAKEIEYQELEIQLSNKRIKELNAKISSKEEAKDKVSEDLQRFKDHLEVKEKELTELIGETEKEEKFLVEKVEDFQKGIEERLLTSYNKIRQRVKNGLAVVPVERGAASGSYFVVPSQIQMEIAQRKKVVIDEHSGRILVDHDLALEQKEKMQEVLSSI